jgi:hypothetical protein
MPCTVKDRSALNCSLATLLTIKPEYPFSRFHCSTSARIRRAGSGNRSPITSGIVVVGACIGIFVGDVYCVGCVDCMEVSVGPSVRPGEGKPIVEGGVTVSGTIGADG